LDRRTGFEASRDVKEVWMTTKTPTRDDSEEIPIQKPARAPEKRRKHGYRGYPNNQAVGGGIHMGSGFAGVGTTTPGDTGLSGSGIIGEKTRASAGKKTEEETEETEE
jgi:hypothetical protein